MLLRAPTCSLVFLAFFCPLLHALQEIAGRAVRVDYASRRQSAPGAPGGGAPGGGRSYGNRGSFGGSGGGGSYGEGY